MWPRWRVMAGARRAGERSRPARPLSTYPSVPPMPSLAARMAWRVMTPAGSFPEAARGLPFRFPADRAAGVRGWSRSRAGERDGGTARPLAKRGGGVSARTFAVVATARIGMSVRSHGTLVSRLFLRPAMIRRPADGRRRRRPRASEGSFLETTVHRPLASCRSRSLLRSSIRNERGDETFRRCPSYASQLLAS
jgi:hypothetical protein